MSPAQAANRIAVLKRKVATLEAQLAAADELIATYVRRAGQLNDELHKRRKASRT